MSLESDIKSFVKSVGLELYDAGIVTENEETIYRVSVIATNLTEDGKKVGVSMEQCVSLTHMISPFLDVTPPVSGDYRLEVGSAGIERKISNMGQFEKSLGEKISILKNDKHKLKGKLLKAENNKIFLDTEDGEVIVDFSEISKAKTYFEW